MSVRAARWTAPAQRADAGPAAAVDEATFRDVYQRLSPAIWGYLRRVTGDASVADDLLQDTFCRLLTSTPPALEAEALRGWLFRVASNLAMDYFRREGRPAQALEPAIDVAAVDARPDVLAERTVRETLSQLNPRERAMLCWRTSKRLRIARSLPLLASAKRVCECCCSGPGTTWHRCCRS